MFLFTESIHNKDVEINGFILHKDTDKYIFLNQSNILPNITCDNFYCGNQNDVEQIQMKDINNCIQNCQEFCIGKYFKNSYCIYNILNVNTTECVCGNVNFICKTELRLLSFYEVDLKFIPIVDYCFDIKTEHKEKYSLTLKKYLINCLRYAKIFDIGNDCISNINLERYLNFIYYNPILSKKML